MGAAGAPSYRVFVSAVGNVFMAEIAAMLADTISATGRQSVLVDAGLPTAEAGVVNLVVAPHEFFVLQDGPSEAEIVRAARQSVTVGVEQPGTPWFEDAARYASYGALTVDINPRGVQELRRRGLDAHRLRFGYYPGWDVWGGDDVRRRDTDVAFLGALTERRAHFLARSAPLLAGWECDLRLFEGVAPVTAGSGHFVTGRAKHELLAGARVLLNVHQGERDYFEWVRVMEAMANGCVVVTETSGGFAPLVPSEHFVQAGLDSLDRDMVELLGDEDRRRHLAHAAYTFVREQMAFVDIVDRFLADLERRLVPLRPSRLSTSSAYAGVGAMMRPERRKPVPPAPTGARGTPDPAASGADRPHGPADRDRLDHGTDTALSGRGPAGGGQAAGRRPAVETACFAAADPEVTIVLALSDGGRPPGRTIDSVIESVGVRTELLIIDDRSDDGSVEAVHRAIGAVPDIPVRWTYHSARRGVSRSWNEGFEAARAEFVLPLEAGAELFPHGLRRLHAALRASDADFAYGIVDRLGDRPEVTSCLPWDVHRLVLTDYIDSMALIRKETWQRCGGFDTPAEEAGGWAVWDLWLHIADGGGRGQLVTDFVGRRPPGDPSSPPVGTPGPGAPPDLLRARYPRLPWPAEAVRP